MYLCYLCPPLAATTIAVTVLLWCVTARYGAFSRSSMKAYQDRLAETNQVAEETLSLITTVRTFGAESREQARYGLQLRKLRYLGLRFALAYLLYLASNSTLYNLNKVLLFMCVSLYSLVCMPLLPCVTRALLLRAFFITRPAAGGDAVCGRLLAEPGQHHRAAADDLCLVC